MSAQETVSSSSTPPALEELQARPQWVCWRKEARGGKPTKVPYNPRTGALARSDDPATWASYSEAKAAWNKRSSRYDGFGYMFRGDYTGIDLDHCVNTAGTIDPWAQTILDRLPSYAEYSPSGTGIHVLVRGTIKSGTRRPLAGEDEGATLLAQVKRREAGMTNLLWHVPGSGFEQGYLPREEYFRRLEVCLASRDPVRREAAIDEMKARVAR